MVGCTTLLSPLRCSATMRTVLLVLVVAAVMWCREAQALQVLMNYEIAYSSDAAYNSTWIGNEHNTVFTAPKHMDKMQNHMSIEVEDNEFVYLTYYYYGAYYSEESGGLSEEEDEAPREEAELFAVPMVLSAVGAAAYPPAGEAEEWMAVHSETASAGTTLSSDGLEAYVNGDVFGGTFVDLDELSWNDAYYPHWGDIIFDCQKNKMLYNLTLQFYRKPIGVALDMGEESAGVEHITLSWVKKCHGSELGPRPGLRVLEKKAQVMAVDDGHSLGMFNFAIDETEDLFTYGEDVFNTKFLVSIPDEQFGTQMIDAVCHSEGNKVLVSTTGPVSQSHFIADKFEQELALLMTCKEKGLHRITVTLKSSLYMDTRFSFAKVCPDVLDPSEVGSINVGTELDHLKDVVVENKAVGKWAIETTDNILPGSKRATTFFITSSDPDKEQPFALIHASTADPHLLGVSIGGEGVDGGIASNVPIEFVVYYHCSRKVSSRVTITIQLPWIEEVTQFSYIKKCWPQGTTKDIAEVSNAEFLKLLFYLTAGVLFVSFACFRFCRRGLPWQRKETMAPLPLSRV